MPHVWFSSRCLVPDEQTITVLPELTSIDYRLISVTRRKRCLAWPVILFEAFTHFQADNGFPVSGILTAAQIDRIRQIADPILAHWQLKPVRHPIAGLPLWVPLGVGFNQIRTRSGIDFENANKVASISFNFFPSGRLGLTYSRLLNVAGFRPVYTKVKDNFFAFKRKEAA